MERVLWLISDNARACLIIGLLLGLGLPGLAAAMAPWLPQMVAGLLVITALRIGHRAANGALSDLRWGLGSVALLQMVLPVGLFAACRLAGIDQTPAALAMVLATAAPALSGSPNLALLLGQDAGRMMQILVLGTACFPLTVLPVLALVPQAGAAQDVALSALRLLAVITGSTALGFFLRARFFPDPAPDTVRSLDGLSVLAFSAIVIGLMAALNPALRSDPVAVLAWGLLAFALSYGIQIAVYLLLSRSPLDTLAGPLAIGAGNRNIALFLVAMPVEIMGPLMVFVGCWQLPMYLTPILLRRLYQPGTP
ncbi:hypothetical protein [Roseobacter sp. S98]|uniref:hypothetical protein n=1 Tax=Roseobacter algicola (ex Choi et al. 2025) (nom. illeg.) TaxID=3092138 RepID=UPI003F51939C